MFIYLNKRGQSTLEYAVVIAIVVAALLAMQTYIKRGVQGRLRSASDDIGEQFSPQYTTYTTTTTIDMTSHETIAGGARPTATTITSQNQQRIHNETVEKLEQEYWK